MPILFKSAAKRGWERMESKMASLPIHGIICRIGGQRSLEVVERTDAIAKTEVHQRQVEWQHRAIS